MPATQTFGSQPEECRPSNLGRLWKAGLGRWLLVFREYWKLTVFAWPLRFIVLRTESNKSLPLSGRTLSWGIASRFQMCPTWPERTLLTRCLSTLAAEID